ncbi:methyltransferase [Enterobacter phage vB_EkoM5VN]|uniref:Methyltransferase n=1 Tax=Enterobacter phage vB_EkoM5VN TaxID=2771379 RepID=A0A7I8HNC5_9CAUD|nr:methyltransferase [Enterobacter phage vB_EkoM5VN]
MSDQLIKNMDLTYSVRMIRLLKKPWTEWTAYKLGIIDGQGEVIKNPKTKEELEAYSPFHRSVRHIKRRLNAVPYMSGFMNLTSAYDSLRSRWNLTEQDHEEIMMNLPELRERLNEEMVAGDSGGSVDNIASGVTTGAITNKGPKVLGSTRPHKRKRKIMKSEE